ncbi:MAG: chemotaxis protein CheX [Spirochaetia bacterium]
MKQSILNTFPTAAKSILSEMGFESIDVNKYEANEECSFLASIGLAGDIHGHFVIYATQTDAYNFANAMMEALSIHSPEEGFGIFRKGVLAEFANQVSGRAAMLLSEKDVECRITPPTIIMGKGVHTDFCTTPTLKKYTIEGTFGTIHFMVGLKNQKEDSKTKKFQAKKREL